MFIPDYQSLMRAFLPEYAGKVQFYLAVLDDLAREEGENHLSVTVVENHLTAAA